MAQYPNLSARKLQNKLSQDLFHQCLVLSDPEKAKEHQEAMRGFAAFPHRAQWYVNKTRRTLGDKMDELHKICDRIEEVFSDRFLQRSHSGRTGPESLDFEYYFFMTSGSSASPVYDREQFSQLDLFLQCLEGGACLRAGCILTTHSKR